ncbi:MAG: hypothetical protein H0Z24_02990 [Thermosipho sp. (in: Bacteria)]|nr:hypothetical protein [Thermosipho sp. (in: thermotogales)]
MELKLKEKCKTCNCCVEVTHTITGYPLKREDRYFQCLAGVEQECAGEGGVYEYDEENM